MMNGHDDEHEPQLESDPGSIGFMPPITAHTASPPRRRGDRSVLISFAAALGIHAMALGAICTWWVGSDSPPAITLRAGAASTKADIIVRDHQALIPAADPLPNQSTIATAIPTRVEPPLVDATIDAQLDQTVTVPSGQHMPSLEQPPPSPLMGVASGQATPKALHGRSRVSATPVHASPAISASPMNSGQGGVRNAPTPFGDNPPPVYPIEALRKRWQGTVILHVEVMADGAVSSVKVARSSGYACLDDSAVEAAKHWHYRPAIIGGMPAAAAANQPVHFTF